MIKKLEDKISILETKLEKEQELDQYIFSYEDIMLKRDIESINNIVNYTYKRTFKSKWDELPVKEKNL